MLELYPGQKFTAAGRPHTLYTVITKYNRHEYTVRAVDRRDGQTVAHGWDLREPPEITLFDTLFDTFKAVEDGEVTRA